MDEDVYKISYEVDTYAEEDILVDTREQLSQASFLNLDRLEVTVTEPSDDEDKDDLIDEYSAVIDIFKGQLQTVSQQAQKEMKILHGEVEDLEEKLKIAQDSDNTSQITKLHTEIGNLQNDIEHLLTEKRQYEDEIKRMEGIHEIEIQDVVERTKNEMKQMLKVATDDKLNDFENAKFELMKQHQNLLDEFVKEQEKQIAELKTGMTRYFF